MQTPFLHNKKVIMKPKEQMKVIYTPNAPEPVGPYSQALLVAGGGQWLICSGQIPLDPKTSQLTGKSVKEQTDRVFKMSMGFYPLQK